MNQFYLLFNAFTLMNVLILSSILFFRKNNSNANRILALIILNPGLNFVNNILIQSGAIFDVPYFLFLFQSTALLYAPLVFAYVCIMMGERFKWVSVLNGITLSVILLEAYYAFGFSQLTLPQQTVYLQGLTNGNYPADQDIINNLFVLTMLAYFIVALIKIRKYKNSAFDFFSDIERTKVRYVWWFIVLLTSLNIALTISYAAFDTPMVEYLGIPLIIIAMYIYIVVYAFNNSAVLSELEYCNFKAEVKPMGSFLKMEEPRCKEIKELKLNNGKYKLTEIEMSENYRKIWEYLENDKPYLDSNINLTKFSSDLKACSHNISLTINCKFEMNFFDLINSYRVEYSKSRLLSFNKNQLTIESVGKESGFNSMSSFYRAFKKHANCTPTEFLSTQTQMAV
jgi:AraC-like DNA-binding protein